MDPVTGAVVIAGLKYVGSPSAALVTNFLEKVFGPTGDAAGTALAHPNVEWQRRRVERGSHTIAGAARSIADASREPQQVPGRVLWPLLERASLEDDAELSKRWIALLTSAATTPDAVLPSFVTILGELSPLEARLLRRIHSACREYALLQNDVIGRRRRTSESARSARAPPRHEPYRLRRYSLGGDVRDPGVQPRTYGARLEVPGSWLDLGSGRNRSRDRRPAQPCEPSASGRSSSS